MLLKLLVSPASQFGAMVSGVMFMLPLGLAWGDALLISLACFNGFLAHRAYKAWLLTQPQETRKDEED